MGARQREWLHAALFVIPALGLLSFMVRDTVEVEAHTPDGAGPIGDSSISSSLTKRIATPAWGTLIFAGGRPVDAEIVTIGGRVFEYDTDSTFPENGGDVVWDCNGNANIDDDIGDLVTAINGDGSATFDCTGDTTNDLAFITADTAGTAGNSIALVEACTNTTVSAGTLLDGTAAAVGSIFAITHTITTTEAAGGADAALRLDTGASSIEALIVNYDDGGVVAILPDGITISGGVITIVEGATAWTNGDKVHVVGICTP